MYSTGKSFSEVLILASTNPQYDKRLSIELPLQYMKTPSLEHVVYTNSFFVFILTFRTTYVLPMCSPCSELGAGNSMNNLLSYCGLDDAKIRASDKDLQLEILTFPWDI